MEEWEQIETSPLYEVSNHGNVRHTKRKMNLKPRSSPKKADYVCYEVNIADETGKQRNQKIHQLVAIAFLPNPNNRSEIDHIDRNPANNKVENLRWVSRSENMINAGLRSDNKSGHTGIYFCSQKQKWKITYQFENKTHHGGFYDTKEEAIANYKDSSNLKSGETLDYTKPLNTKTGQKHISINRNRFVVEITRAGVRNRSSHTTLEEAVAYRDKILAPT